jgi:ribosomal protein S18 acetylase RimI-like enzyme
LEDLEAITELARTSEIALHGEAETTLEDIQHTWQSPGFNPETDSSVIFSPSGQLIAFIRIDHHDHAHIYFDWQIHPAYRNQDLGSYLVHLAEKRAQEHIMLASPDARVVLLSLADNQDVTARQLFEQNGFHLVRHYWRMAIAMQEIPAEPQWPTGITVRTMAPGMERTVFEADDEIFRDHWGYIPDEYEEWLYWMTGREGFDPSLWFLAMDGEQIAGISLCGIEKASGAWVNVLGVRRPWRRQRLALALLQHSFRAFYERGLYTVYLAVDAQSLTGATRLYEQAGMHIVRQRDKYEKELRAGRELSTQTVEG